MNNLETWNKLKKPPPEALKIIRGGRIAGMTDIKPQWRYQIMTETFGLCGVGWKFDVINKWIEEGSHEQKIAFVDIKLFVKIDGEWSEPICGNGGSMLVVKESAGLHTSDEAYKMATTDALSTAMKMIGVASDIYMGLWDGSKYKDGSPKGTTDDEEKPIPIKQLQHEISEFLKDMKNEAVSGYELPEDIRKKIKKELKVNMVAECSDRDTLEKFYNKIDCDFEHEKLEIMMGQKGMGEESQRYEFAHKALNMPLKECYDKSKLTELRTKIIGV